MNRVFNFTHLLLIIFTLFLVFTQVSSVWGTKEQDNNVKKFSVGTEIDLLGALGLGFVNIRGSYYLNKKSFLTASASIALKEEGSHYSVRYNHIFVRTIWQDWITGDKDLIEIYGIAGLTLFKKRDYFEEGEEGDVKYGFRSGNSAIFIFPSVGIGIRGPFKLFGLFAIPNVWMDAFVSLPPTVTGVGIEYRF